MWTTILMAIAILLVSWVGLVMYARYADCDPLLNGQIQSRDQVFLS